MNSSAPVNSSRDRGTGLSSQTLDENRVADAIDAIVREHWAQPPSIGGRVGQSLRDLTSATRHAWRGLMVQSSKLGIEICETAINMGWLFHDFREVAQASISIASAVQELDASIVDLARNSSASAEQAVGARETIACCIRDSRQTIDAMDTIEKRVKSIGDRMAVLEAAVSQIGGMAGAIDAIARQTNLLALNATIEAARAGEAGAGFAVVAQEVKTLSIQTGQATTQIRSRLTTLMSETESISTAVHESLTAAGQGSSVAKQVGAIIEGAGDEITEVAERMRSLSDVLAQQRAATTEISEKVHCISEKAVKTRDEFRLISERLSRATELSKSTLSDVKGPRVAELPAIRLIACAAKWKHELSNLLLGVTPCPASAPKLDAGEAIAVLTDIFGQGEESNHIAKIAACVQQANRSAENMVAGLRASNWDQATPAYIQCQERVDEAIQSLYKVLS